MKNINFFIENEVKEGDQIVSDEKKLKQVLINLLSNCFENTRNGYVCVKVSSSTLSNDNHIAVNMQENNSGLLAAYQILTFEVIDSGKGMNLEQQVITMPFAIQSTTSIKETIQGAHLGLGLLISRNICQLIGPAPLRIYSKSN